MTDPFNIEIDGVEVSVTHKAAGGYEAPWVVFKGDLDVVARKHGYTGEAPAKASDLIKVVSPVARYFQTQWRASEPGKA